jgi:hypothetical protein
LPNVVVFRAETDASIPILANNAPIKRIGIHEMRLPVSNLASPSAKQVELPLAWADFIICSNGATPYECYTMHQWRGTAVKNLIFRILEALRNASLTDDEYHVLCSLRIQIRFAPPQMDSPSRFSPRTYHC